MTCFPLSMTNHEEDEILGIGKRVPPPPLPPQAPSFSLGSSLAFGNVSPKAATAGAVCVVMCATCGHGDFPQNSPGPDVIDRMSSGYLGMSQHRGTPEWWFPVGFPFNQPQKGTVNRDRPIYRSI